MKIFEIRMTILLCVSGLFYGCVSYEPRSIAPSITYSPEQMTFRNETNGDNAIEFGLNVSANESDSLFNVEVLPGVRVRQLDAGSPAAASGIQVGDILLRLDDMPINSPDTLTALQQTERESLEFTAVVRRGTTVFETQIEARKVATQKPPVELYRADPIASRAGFKTVLIDINGRKGIASAELVEFFEKSPLPNAGFQIGDRVLMIENGEINSAQDLINQLNQDYSLGEQVEITFVRDNQILTQNLRLWDPGRRLSRISLGPLLNYQTSLSPTSKQLSILDLWLFSVYSYSRLEGEKSHSFLGLFNYSSDLGELVEE